MSFQGSLQGFQFAIKTEKNTAPLDLERLTKQHLWLLIVRFVPTNS